ncbi:MAG: FtsX-like permease family protein [Spirochaetes bacterium]|jgi:putative ABC transport system permease protein|nr:FtsX-like permease family protein [Spirochaetota bacterium]
MDLSRIAWKNVFRNRRRSVLNVVALTIGITIMIIGLGWVGGYNTYVFGALIDFQTGHAQVLNQKYFDEAARFPLDITVPEYTELRKRLLEHPQVVEAAGRVNFSVELSNQRAGIRLAGKAIEPAREARVTVIDEYVTEGSYLTEKSGIMVGRPIAERLSLSVGDVVFLTATDKHGAQNFVDAPIVGIFDFGYPEIDENVIFMDMAGAQSFLRLDNEVTRLALRSSDGTNVAGLVRELEELVSGVSVDGSDGGATLTVEEWQRFVRAAVVAVKSDTFFFWVMLVILFILIIVGIVNSMSMAVLERTDELGTLRAVGMRNAALVRLVVIEGMWISAIAVAAALVVSTPIAIYLSTAGLDVSQALPENVPIPFGETFNADFAVWHYLVSIGVAVATAVLGSLIPASRAAGMNIVTAMYGERA